MLEDIKQVEVVGPLIDDLVLREEQRTPKTFNASKIGNCGRELIYGLRSYIPTVNRKPEWSRDAHAGEALHEVYQSYFEKTNLLKRTEDALKKVRDFQPYPEEVVLPEFAKELRLWPNDEMIGGRVDAVIEKDKDYVAEIKTLKTKDWGNIPSYKLKKFYDQIQIYLYFFNIKQGLLVCVARNDSLIKEFEVPYDKKYAETVVRRIRNLKKIHLAGDLPAAEKSRNNCMFCGYKGICLIDE